MRSRRLEIAVTSATGSAIAVRNGADRVELCTGLELGGLTPSLGLVEQAMATGAEIHALIRCRPGGFVYDAEELATMRRDVQLLVRSGVAGVVIGALLDDGALDRDATRALSDSAREGSDDVQVTFHRAVDRSADPIRLVGTLAGMGIDRILTSGAAPAAQEGTDVLRRMADVRGAVEIMAGGGLAPESIGAVVAAGATSVHLSAKKAVLEDGMAGGSAVPLGTADPGASHFVTDADTVRRARSALDALETE